VIPPIKGFIENTLIDWEGKIASILFLPQCNFRCPYCHSPHLVTTPNDLESIPFESVSDLLKRHSGWIDGVVITGGEPTLQDGLPELAERIKKMGLLVKLDTNGTAPDVVRQLIHDRLVDYVAMDIKAPFSAERYEPVAGVPCDIAALEDTAALLLQNGGDYEFRTTVCPAFLNSDDVVQIAQAIRGAKRYILQLFQPKSCLDPAMLSVQPYTRAQVRSFAARASEFVSTCTVRGDVGGPPSAR
jgi:pyruvate formate lyase activating enzyme